MQGYIDELEKRKAILKKCIARVENGLKDAGPGHLFISGKGKQASFYRVQDPKGKKRIYIHKRDIDQAQTLASADYLKRLLPRIRRELKLLERYLSFLGKGTAEDLYSSLCSTRQELIRPLLVTDDICADLWKTEPFQQSAYMPEMKIYPTKNGDMVRSKSEVLFADLFTDMGIPYRYEEVITLPDGQVMIPDFSLWDKKRRRVIYHEHFGKMDDPAYRKRNLKKIDDYRRNGIFSGKNLILTFEGDGAILNMREIRNMVEEIMR